MEKISVLRFENPGNVYENTRSPSGISITILPVHLPLPLLLHVITGVHHGIGKSARISSGVSPSLVPVYFPWSPVSDQIRIEIL